MLKTHFTWQRVSLGFVHKTVCGSYQRTHVTNNRSETTCDRCQHIVDNYDASQDSLWQLKHGA